MLAPLAARLGCAALMIAALPFAKAFAAPASPDVAGIRLGSSPDEAQSALRAMGDVTLDERTGTLSMKDYTTARLHMGLESRIGKEIVPEKISLLYDLKPPQSVIGVWRQQPFQKPKAPLASYIRNALIEKYGQPLYDADLNHTTRVMLWNFGGQISFPTQSSMSVLRYGDCTRLIAAGPRLINGGYQAGVEPVAQKCGTWIQIFIESFEDNHDLVSSIQTALVDLPKMRTSYDYVVETLKNGVASKHQLDNGDAANNKPKL